MPLLVSAWSSGVSPGASIACIKTDANSVTLISYHGPKGTGEVMLVIPHLRVLLSPCPVNDNVMIVIEEPMEDGGIEIGVLNDLSWKLGYFHLSKASRRYQMSS